MTTYEKLCAIEKLADVGQCTSAIEGVILDTIKRVAVTGDAAPAGPLPPFLAGWDRDALTRHFAEPSVAELRDYQTKSKIMAIKAYRARTDASLKDSKDRIEQAAEALGLFQEKYEKHPLASENEKLKKLLATLCDAEDRRVSRMDLYDEHHCAWGEARKIAEGCMPF